MGRKTPPSDQPADEEEDRKRRPRHASGETAAASDRESEPREQAQEPPVVGIGASAGGLGALRKFFANVPEGSGLAYVVVVHLSPEHKSHMADVLQASVRMPVEQVTETTLLRRDHVYVIPPGRNLSTIDTHLRLSELEENRLRRAPIDHFFRTLAGTHNAHAIGVVLTGTGSDGTLGIKEIKEHGGLTIAQDPNEAEYDAMPQSAIATGLVDLVLPVEDIPPRILRFTRTRPRVAVPQMGMTWTRRNGSFCRRSSPRSGRAPAAISAATSAPPSCVASSAACSSITSRSWSTTSISCAASRKRCGAWRMSS